MYNRKIILILFLISLVCLESCKLMFPNRMFQKQNYEYFSVGQDILDNYTIEKGDYLTLTIYSREGFDLIDVLPNETGGGSSQQRNQGGGNNSVTSGLGSNIYLVEQDGFVELPLFGRTYVLGMTENQLENYIEDKCRAIFNEPYAVLRVTNRRTFVFMGSKASV